MSTPNVASAYVTLLPRAPNFATLGAAELRPQLAQLSRASGGLGRSLGRVTTEAGDFRRGMFAASLSVAGLRGAVLAAGSSFLVGAGLIRGMELFIGLSAEFQRSMSQFQAVTHATTAEMKQAREEAIRLGNDIRLPSTSASDAAVAMTELARGGLSVTESMNAARGALTLATAASTDFATAAQIQARVLQSFALAGDEATHVADVLANSANQSTGEITDMAFALRQSSAVAHQAGLSLEDTAAALTEMANAGIVGSDAGTSLRTMLLRLNPVTDKAKELMKDLGIVTTDAQGNFLPFIEVIRRYQTVLERLTPAQRQSALMTLFGQDAIRASTIIFGEGAREFERNRRAVERQGSAAQLAAARNKGLTGTFDALRSQMQSTAIQIGQNLLPGLTNFVSGINRVFSELSRSGTATETVRTLGQAGGTTIRAVGEAAGTAAPLVIGFANAIAFLANTIGGANIAAFFVAFKGTQLLFPRLVAGTSKLSNAQKVLAGDLLITGRAGLKVKTGLTEMAVAQQVLGTETGRAALAKQAEAAATKTAMTAEEGFARVLTGNTDTTARNVALAEALAFNRTKLSKTTLQLARDEEALAAAAEAELAIAQRGGRAQEVRAIPTRGQFVSAEQAAITAGFARQAATVSGGMVQAEVAAAKLGTRLRTLGSSIVAFVGGPLNAWAIGIGAVALAYVKFIREADDSNARLARGIQQLNDATIGLTDTTDRLAGSRSALRADTLSTEQARLNVSLAEGAVEQARLHGGTQDLRAANLQLQQSQLGLSDSIRKTNEDIRQQNILEAQASAAMHNHQRAANELAADLQNKLRVAMGNLGFRETLTQQLEVFFHPGRIMEAREQLWNRIFSPDENATRGLEDFISKVQDMAQEQRDQLNPVQAHSLDLIAEYAQKTGIVNKAISARILLENQQATGLFHIAGVTLGMSSLMIKQFDRMGDARHNMVSEWASMPPIMRTLGVKGAEELARGFAIGILTGKGGLITIWRQQLALMIAQGQQQIQQAIVSAQNNMLSIASSLDSQIAEMIDAGPLGVEIDKLQTKLDALQRTGERIRLLRDLASANRALARRRESLDPLASTHLTPAENAARKRGVQDFLQPAIDARDDAQRALNQFNIQGVIDNLRKAQDAQKRAVAHGISDVVAAFAAGRIKASEAIKRLATIIGNAEHSAAFKTAGTTLGVAFVEGFKAAGVDLIAQLKELAKPQVAAATKGFPGPGVERPSETMREVHDRISIARAEEAIKEQKAIRLYTKKIFDKLDAGVTPSRAVRTVRITAGRVVVQEQRGGGPR